MKIIEQKLTIRDVAKKSGYSVYTVSGALNENPKVAPSTRKKILEVVKRMNYTPGFNARCLALKKSFTIGLVMSDITNPFLAKLVSSLEEAIHDKGYSMLLMIGQTDQEKIQKCINILKRKQVDGILVWSNDPSVVKEYLFNFKERTPPFLLLGNTSDYSVDYVSTDRIHGMELAITHLYSRGYRRIGCIGISEEMGKNTKFAGFVQGLKKKRLNLYPELIFKDINDKKDAFYFAERLSNIKNPPTAIMAANDELALGLLNGFLRLGKRVPQDMAIIGYDGIEATKFAVVKLTTIAQPLKELIRKSVKILLDKIEGKENEIKQILLPPKLIVEESA